MSINNTRYIKNNTGSPIYYIGVPVPAGEFLQIPPEKYTTYSNSDSLIADISSGDVSISMDGSTVIDGISDQINALKGYSGPVDTDGAPISRQKITQSGWHYQLYTVEFETAKLNSLVDNDVYNNNNGSASIKFYNSSDVELTAGTQLELDLNCVKTVIDWEPNWDYEIIGGQFRQESIPGSNVRMHVIAVPDLTAEQGGSVPFVNNMNLKYIGNEDSIKTDGRTSKKMLYDATYHTNKIRLIFHHNILLNHSIQISFEIYRA